MSTFGDQCVNSNLISMNVLFLFIATVFKLQSKFRSLLDSPVCVSPTDAHWISTLIVRYITSSTAKLFSCLKL